MKIILSVWCAFALVFCIYPIDASEVELQFRQNFVNLPAELRLEIFERFEFDDLFRVSQVIPDDRDLIGKVFQKLLKHQAFRMVSGQNYADISDIHIYVGEVNVFTSFYEYDIDAVDDILEFLQYFGYCITKFEFWNKSVTDRDLRCEFEKQIRNYVAEFVNEVIINMDHEIFKDFIIPFRNAKFAKLSDGKIDATNLREMFPAVRTLELEDATLIGNFCHFPHLERLNAPFWWGDNELKQSLEMNPQLKHLSIHKYKWNIIEMIHKTGPDLESLEFSAIDYNGYQNEPVRFANMKVLKIVAAKDVRIQPPGPLEFGNLEEIEVNCQNFADYWFNIMMGNKKLRKVTFRKAFGRDNLERIANELPNLEDFSMDCYGSREVRSSEDIVYFLQKAKTLKMATFKSLEADKCNEAAQQLNNNWRTIDMHPADCCFTRKHF